MIPFATIGFLVVGILFLVFAITFQFSIGRNIPALENFAYAYGAVSMALLLWGITLLTLNMHIMSESIVIGDIFLLSGTVFLLDILVQQRKKGDRWGIIIGELLTVGFLILRVFFYYPHPQLQSGILFFNTQAPISIFLGCLIVLVWLPSAFYASTLIAHHLRHEEFSYVYRSLYIMAAFSLLLFLIAKTLLLIVLSFLCIGICFVLLIFSNIIGGKVGKQRDG